MKKFTALLKPNGTREIRNFFEMTDEKALSLVKEGFMGYCVFASRSKVFAQKNVITPNIFWVGEILALEVAREKNYINKHTYETLANQEVMYVHCFKEVTPIKGEHRLYLVEQQEAA